MGRETGRKENSEDLGRKPIGKKRNNNKIKETKKKKKNPNHWKPSAEFTHGQSGKKWPVQARCWEMLPCSACCQAWSRPLFPVLGFM